MDTKIEERIKELSEDVQKRKLILQQFINKNAEAIENEKQAITSINGGIIELQKLVPMSNEKPKVEEKTKELKTKNTIVCKPKDGSKKG